MKIQYTLLAALATLLLATNLVAQDMQSASAPSTQPTTRPATLAPNDVITQMLKPSGGASAKPLKPIENPPIFDQTTGKMVAPPPAVQPQSTLIREGDWIRDRTGRLTKSADGSLMEFTFDTDGRAMQDPPMIILPNLKLMQMENAVAGTGRDLRFKITGQVTEYKGHNYILLEKVLVVPDVVQQF